MVVSTTPVYWNGYREDFESAEQEKEFREAFHTTRVGVWPEEWNRDRACFISGWNSMKLHMKGK